MVLNDIYHERHRIFIEAKVVSSYICPGFNSSFSNGSYKWHYALMGSILGYSILSKRQTILLVRKKVFAFNS